MRLWTEAVERGVGGHTAENVRVLRPVPACRNRGFVKGFIRMYCKFSVVVLRQLDRLRCSHKDS